MRKIKESFTPLCLIFISFPNEITGYKDESSKRHNHLQYEQAIHYNLHPTFCGKNLRNVQSNGYTSTTHYFEKISEILECAASCTGVEFDEVDSAKLSKTKLRIVS